LQPIRVFKNSDVEAASYIDSFESKPE